MTDNKPRRLVLRRSIGGLDPRREPRAVVDPETDDMNISELYAYAERMGAVDSGTHRSRTPS